MARNLFTYREESLYFYVPEGLEDVEEMIREGGGTVTYWPTCHSICLASPGEGVDVHLDREVFSSDFIKDSVVAKRMLDLKNYRLSLTTIQSSPQNASPESCSRDEDGDVLSERKETLEEGKERMDKDSSECSTETEDSDSDDEWMRMPILTTKPRIPRIRRKRGPDYTFSEELKILEYIKKNHMHLKIKGRAMWETMEKDNVLQERTWQSIKNHFLRSMLPKIQAYEVLGARDIEKFTKFLS